MIERTTYNNNNNIQQPKNLTKLN